jgi:hypothetical protein
MIITQVNEPGEPQAKSGGVKSRVVAFKMKREGKKYTLLQMKTLNN